MSIVRRQFLKAAVAAVAATGTTACFGSFPAIRWVYGFNKSMGPKFIQWLVFLVLTILPVYGIAALIDIWILNSIEFWFGGSSAAEKETEKDERLVQLKNGETLLLRKDKAAGRFEMHYSGGEKELTLRFDMNEDRARAYDGAGREIARASEKRDGAVEIHAGGTLVETYDAVTVDDAVHTYEQGGAQATAAWAARQVVRTDGYARR